MKKLILSIIATTLLLSAFFLKGTPPPPGPLPQDAPTLRKGPKGHDVSIYEITQKQYQLVMGNNPSHFKGDNLPVENVSWRDAVEFCRKLTLQERQKGNIQENERYILTSGDFYESVSEQKGWTKSSISDRTQNVEKTYPSIYYTFTEKEFFFYGVHGNVSEWILERDKNTGFPQRRGDNFKSKKTSHNTPISLADYRGNDTGFRVQLCNMTWREIIRDFVSSGLDEETKEWLLYTRNLMHLAENKDLAKDLIQIATSNKDDTILKFIHDASSIPLYAIEGITDKYGIEMCKVPLPGNNGCFYMSKYEITQEEYEAVMGEPALRNYTTYDGKTHERHLHGAYYISPRYPVGEVTWNDAMKFCEKLTKLRQKSGFIPKDLVYTLPSEEEWVYACRAGTTTAFNNGGNTAEDLGKVGWYNANSDDKPHRVGEKQANRFGIHDMHGNMQEWLREKYTEYDKYDMRNYDWYPFRGGSFGSSASSCKVNPDHKTIHSQSLLDCPGGLFNKGIRIVLIPEDQSKIKILKSREQYTSANY